MSISIAKIQPWYEGIPRSTGRAKLFGSVVMVATVMGFGVWGNTAPISGAVIATGVFVTTGQNKTIQHLEGGVINKIMVREGDVVESGQLLMTLDDVAPRAELRRLLLRQMRAEAIETRLRAEAASKPRLEFPMHLLAAEGDPDIATMLSSQRSTFAARQASITSDIITYQKSIDGLEERITGSRAQLAAIHEQSKLLKEELEAKTALLARGYIRKPEVLALQRASANLQGEVGRITGDIGDSRERIARSLEQIEGVRKLAAKTASEQLQEIGGELNDVRERGRSIRNQLDRMRITAPVKGTVVKMRYHTTGGVIEPGKSIMEIVSLQDEILIEARVRPQDIDKIKHSQIAMVRLTALNQRTTPMVDGQVIYISADALPDDKTRSLPAAPDIYVVRVRLDGASVDKIRGFEPTPGMPAEVYIRTTERTFFEYLMQPLRDSMSRAFRES